VSLGANPIETPVGLEIGTAHAKGFAETAGLQEGDLLLTLRGIRLHDIQQLFTVLALTQPGEAAEVTWARGREPMSGKATF
jgi:S1-C subfamily serine protease